MGHGCASRFVRIAIESLDRFAPVMSERFLIQNSKLKTLEKVTDEIEGTA
jgi:hypothetical protein